MRRLGRIRNSECGKRAEGGKGELKSESFDFGLQISDFGLNN
jgi:hypothetical protein